MPLLFTAEKFAGGVDAGYAGNAKVNEGTIATALIKQKKARRLKSKLAIELRH